MSIRGLSLKSVLMVFIWILMENPKLLLLKMERSVSSWTVFLHSLKIHIL